MDSPLAIDMPKGEMMAATHKSDADQEKSGVVKMGRGRPKWAVKVGRGNGEWRMGNGEWGVGNGEWGVGNGEWGAETLLAITSHD